VKFRVIDQHSHDARSPIHIIEQTTGWEVGWINRYLDREYVRRLVEGLFDYAVLWQAGFHHLTCSLGTHLNACQFRQLCDNQRTVYLTFDVDANGSGQQASQQLAYRLWARGIATRRVLLLAE
jgi:hypothetical protein